jgi:hypothetical protein
LIQKQLMVPSQRRVNLAMLIEVWRYGPGTVSHVHEKNHAFSDVDEETYVATTPEVRELVLWFKY